MLQKRNTPVLRFRNLIFKDVLGVLEDWGFDHIKCFTFITQIREGHKSSLKIRITGSNGLIGHTMTMEALKAIKIVGNQNDGRAVFLFLPNTG